MPIKNPKELFVLLLTNVRNGVQRHTSIYQEMGQLVQDPEIRRRARSILATNRGS